MKTKLDSIESKKLFLVDSNGVNKGQLLVDTVGRLALTIGGSTSYFALERPFTSIPQPYPSDTISLDISKGGNFMLGSTGGPFDANSSLKINFTGFAGALVSGIVLINLVSVNSGITSYRFPGANVINRMVDLPVGEAVSNVFDVITYFTDGNRVFVSLANSWG